MTDKQLEVGILNSDKRRNIHNYMPYIRNMGEYELQLVSKKDPERTICFDTIDLKKGELTYITSILTDARKEIADYLESVVDILAEEFKII